MSCEIETAASENFNSRDSFNRDLSNGIWQNITNKGSNNEQVQAAMFMPGMNMMGYNMNPMLNMGMMSNPMMSGMGGYGNMNPMLGMGMRNPMFGMIQQRMMMNQYYQRMRNMNNLQQQNRQLNQNANYINEARLGFDVGVTNDNGLQQALQQALKKGEPVCLMVGSAYDRNSRIAMQAMPQVHSTFANQAEFIYVDRDAVLNNPQASYNPTIRQLVTQNPTSTMLMFSQHADAVGRPIADNGRQQNQT